MFKLEPDIKNNVLCGIYNILLTAFILSIFEIIFFYVVIVGTNVKEERERGLNEAAELISNKLSDVSFDTIVKEEEEKGIKEVSGLISDKLSDKLSNKTFDTIVKEEVEKGLKDSAELFSNKLSDKLSNKTLDKHIQKLNKILNFLPEVDGKLKKSKIPEHIPILETMADREKNLINKINIYVALTAVIICIVLFFSIKKLRKLIVDNDDFRKHEIKFGEVLQMNTIGSVFTVLLIVGFQINFYFLVQAYHLNIKKEYTDILIQLIWDNIEYR